MEFSVNHTIEILRSTPDVLRALLGDLSEPWVRNNYGEQTFSPFDVVGHLIHGEREDWIARAQVTIKHGESRPFEPFDRYAMYEASEGKSIHDLLDTFRTLRAENLAHLKDMHLSSQQLDLRATHPEFGSVTLRQLLATWAVHDLHHIAQICKSLSYQYRDEVGPWKAYIGIIPK